MRSENNSRLLWTSLILAGLILAAFQLYLNREPARIQAVQAADRQQLISAGQELYRQNCASCHGVEGEGVDAPALNAKQFLAQAHDEVIFNIIASGIPGSEMPAWSQAHGGPFTDEEIRQMVAFIRSWEPIAPDLGQQRMRVDARRGAQIYAGTCAICHGPNGQGGTAPALNDPVKLQQFDDNWYAETIARGRPAQGMPVWGTVLSPQQIGDLVALIGAWRRGEEIVVGGVASLLKDAMHALEHGEIVEAAELLEQAAGSAEHEQAIAALEAGNIQEAEVLLKQSEGMMGEMMEAEAGEHDEAAPAEEEHAEETTLPAAETSEAALDPGIAHLQEAVHALEHNELNEARKALTEAMELLSPGELFEAAEHGLEDIEADKPDEALTVLTEALTAAGILLPEEEQETEETPAAETPKAVVDPGIAHLQEAIHALEHNELDEAKKALTEALELLPSGDLFEVAEHALEDIEAGKPGEALETLAKALADTGQP